MRRALSLFVFSIFLPLLAGAQPPSESLEETLSELESSRERQEELADKQKRNEGEIASLTQQSRELSAAVRALDTRIAEKSRALNRAERDLAAKQQRLAARQEEIAAIVYGMIRMQRVPRQFVLARPGDADALLRTAGALDLAYRATGDAVAALEAEMAALKELEAEILEDSAALAEEKATRHEKMASLQEALTERQALQRKLGGEQRSLSNRISELSQRSASLQELIDKLAREEALFRSLGVPQAKPSPPARAGRSPRPAAYPAAGKVLHRFGQTKGPGERYNGHVLRTDASALVTATLDGQVVFADDFMEYGRMVILRHADGYHTVTAGLEQVHVEPGQQLEAGDPLGLMGATLPTRQLYFEVRKHSKAIDPAVWMGKLRASVASRQ